MFHGFAQCSDAFFEMAIHLALNGFIVHLIDFEGYGYSSGKRIAGLTIEQMHRQVTSLLAQVRPDLPLFLLGHSMGCLILDSYQGMNKAIADKIAGVIYSAPFFGFPDFANITWLKKQMAYALAPLLEEFALAVPRPMHKVCRNKQVMRNVLTEAKGPPYASLGL